MTNDEVNFGHLVKFELGVLALRFETDATTHPAVLLSCQGHGVWPLITLFCFPKINARL